MFNFHQQDNYYICPDCDGTGYKKQEYYIEDCYFPPYNTTGQKPVNYWTSANASVCITCRGSGIVRGKC